MVKTYSELQQERAGTLNRNKGIVFRYQLGIPQVELARHYNLTRQRIHQIIHRVYPQTQQNQNLGGFWSKLMSRLFRKENTHC